MCQAVEEYANRKAARAAARAAVRSAVEAFVEVGLDKDSVIKRVCSKYNVGEDVVGALYDSYSAVVV